MQDISTAGEIATEQVSAKRKAKLEVEVLVEDIIAAKSVELLSEKVSTSIFSVKYIGILPIMKKTCRQSATSGIRIGEKSPIHGLNCVPFLYAMLEDVNRGSALHRGSPIAGEVITKTQATLNKNGDVLHT